MDLLLWRLKRLQQATAPLMITATPVALFGFTDFFAQVWFLFVGYWIAYFLISVANSIRAFQKKLEDPIYRGDLRKESWETAAYLLTMLVGLGITVVAAKLWIGDDWAGFLFWPSFFIAAGLLHWLRDTLNKMFPPVEKKDNMPK